MPTPSFCAVSLPTSFIMSTMPTTPAMSSRPIRPPTRSLSASQTWRTKSMVVYQEYLSVLPRLASTTENESP